MRVITGSARGRRLNMLPGTDVVRPTTDKVKEAVFSSIQFDIEGRRVLDLFAGSGQLGIEALSRGAHSAVFVDRSPACIDIIKQNLKITNLSDKAEVFSGDYASFLTRCNNKFDIAFLDPPYMAGILVKALQSVTECMSDYGLIFCEHPSDAPLPEAAGDFTKSKVFKFGGISVTMYKKVLLKNE